MTIENSGHRLLRDALKLTRVLGYTQREQRANLALLYYWGHQYDHLVPWTTPDTPLREKAPSVRLRINKVAVDTLVSHLFGVGRQPRFTAEGDDELSKQLQTLIDSSRLTSMFMSLGRMGCLTGTVVLGAHLYQGEVDWSVTVGARCTPTFGRDDRARARELNLRFDDLLELDERWRTMREDDLGMPVEVWHRRTWTPTETVEYHEIEGPIRRAVDLTWERDEEASITHGLGFVPAEFICNLPVVDDIDGAPVVDVAEFELEDEINYTMSQTGRGIRYNQEPTLALTNADTAGMQVIKRGGHNTLDIKADRQASESAQAGVQLLEMAGAGSTVAMAYAQKLTDYFYQITRVVIHNPDRAGGVLSGVALERVKEPMLALVSELRPQYGHGLERLLEKVLAALTGKRLRDISVTSSWPSAVEPTHDDALTLVMLLRELLAENLITRETALSKIAPFTGIADVKVYAQSLIEEQRRQGTSAPPGREQVNQAVDDLEQL